MRIFLSNGVRHHHEQSVADLAKRLPALLPVFNAVLQGHKERIAKHFGSIFKAHPVLALVGEVFRLVLLKTDSAHYIIITTNSALCNRRYPAVRLSRFCAEYAGSSMNTRFDREK